MYNERFGDEFATELMETDASQLVWRMTLIYLDCLVTHQMILPFELVSVFDCRNAAFAFVPTMMELNCVSYLVVIIFIVPV